MFTRSFTRQDLTPRYARRDAPDHKTKIELEIPHNFCTLVHKLDKNKLRGMTWEDVQNYTIVKVAERYGYFYILSDDRATVDGYINRIPVDAKKLEHRASRGYNAAGNRNTLRLITFYSQIAELTRGGGYYLSTHVQTGEVFQIPAYQVWDVFMSKKFRAASAYNAPRNNN